MIICKVTMTDLYGGEFNYSWVKRLNLEFNDTASNLSIIRRIKSELGISGIKPKYKEFNKNSEFGLYYFKGFGVEFYLEYI